METKKVDVEKPKFYCEKCNYKCSMLHHYKQHTTTTKHQLILFGKKMETVETKTKNACECGKIYKNRDGLWKHKKKCDKINNELTEPISELRPENNNIILELLKQNSEFQKLIIDQNNKIMELSKNNGVTNNNCHNKTKFNLNFFLNEKCKDAVNIMDFVNDLQIKISDLENVGKLGYAEGISKIFINGLQQLDVLKRPIHCSDVKREVLYVKDQDSWEKENEENNKIKKAIHHISHKNIQQIPKWTAQHPHYKESDSKQNDQYLQILCESMGATEPSNLDKVIHNIAREVVIEK
jgi:hypothetical protein